MHPYVEEKKGNERKGTQGGGLGLEKSVRTWLCFVHRQVKRSEDSRSCVHIVMFFMQDDAR